MKIPTGATSFCAPPSPLQAGSFRGPAIRHTFRPQGTRDWLLIYTQAGSGLYRFPGGDFRSRPHDITLYRPGAFQDYQTCPESQRWDLLYAHFLPRPDWLPWLNWPEKSPGLMSLTLKEPALRRRVVAPPSGHDPAQCRFPIAWPDLRPECAGGSPALVRFDQPAAGVVATRSPRAQGDGFSRRARVGAFFGGPPRARGRLVVVAPSSSFSRASRKFSPPFSGGTTPAPGEGLARLVPPDHRRNRVRTRVRESFLFHPPLQETDRRKSARLPATVPSVPYVLSPCPKTGKKRNNTAPTVKNSTGKLISHACSGAKA